MLGDEVFKLHLVPSGVLYPHIVPVIGPGVVVNPATLIDELDGLTSRGIDVGRLRASFARARDPAVPPGPRRRPRERAWAGRRSGRPAAGSGRPTRIERPGPASGSRTSSTTTRSATKLERVLPEKNAVLAALGAEARFEVEPLVEQCLAWGRAPRARTSPTSTWLVQDALRRGDHVLLEGAQGTLLDIDHGSYPFVTSSSPIAGGACTGGGIGPRQVDEVFGVMKAYATRVGSGPFPTELLDGVGQGIAERGHEVGTTTGRPRRVGFFDAVLGALRRRGQLASARSCSTSSTSCPASTRSGCASPTRSTAGGSRRGRRRRLLLERATPIYEEFPGWEEPIHGVRALADLPDAARRYVTALEEHAGAPIVLVSVGPERTQTIERAWRPMRHRRRGPMRGRPRGRR